MTDNNSQSSFSRIVTQAVENIQSRVEALQGTFNIDSGIGKGTTITVDLPIQN